MTISSDLQEPLWLVLAFVFVTFSRFYLDQKEWPAPIARSWDGHRPMQCAACLHSSRTSVMDPIIMAIVHNSTCSPLTRLPEDLLLEVMKLITPWPASMQSLRHTSRVFMRLYASPEFAKTNDLKLQPFTGSTFWVQPGRPYLRRRHEKEARIRVDRDVKDYCDDCQSVRCAPDWNVKAGKLMSNEQYCFRCRKTHPRALFSASQRSFLPILDNRFACIGRRGHVRLCAHKVIQWDDLVVLAKRLSKIRCVPSEELPVLSCTHPSHRPKHRNRIGGGCEKTSTCIKASMPSALLQHRSKHNLTLVLKWQGHLLVDTPGPHGTSPAQLRKQLEVLREGCAEFIAPIMSPGRMPEMNCFDPNRCSCLYLEGRENMNHWAMPCPSHLTQPSCRLPGQVQLSPLQPRSSPGLSSSTDVSRTVNSKKNYGASRHYARIQTMGVGNQGASRLEIEVERCERGDDCCMTITYRREIDLSGSETKYCSWNVDEVTPGWCQALEPKSYDLTQDSESYGVTWCHTPGCKNYHRYLGKLLFLWRGSDRTKYMADVDNFSNSTRFCV